VLNKTETIMFYALSWFVVFGLLALWSLAAWAFHAVTAWTVSNAGVLAGGTGMTEGLRLPEWIAPWVPPELAAALTSVVAAFMPAVEAMLGWAPALAGGLSVAVWVVWAIGSALLIVLGVVLSAMIAAFRRRSTMPAVRSEVRQSRADGQIGELLETNLRSR
jgi:membrane protein implicated in regulation of membrane protease activity